MSNPNYTDPAANNASSGLPTPRANRFLSHSYNPDMNNWTYVNPNPNMSHNNQMPPTQIAMHVNVHANTVVPNHFSDNRALNTAIRIRRNKSRRGRTPHLPADKNAALEAARIAANCPDPGRNAKDRFKCHLPHCGKSFQRRYNLKVHARKHTKETPYSCKVPGCLKKFKWRSSMAHHQKTHKKDIRVPAGYGTIRGTPRTAVTAQNNSLPPMQPGGMNDNVASANTEVSTWYNNMPHMHHEQMPPQALNGSLSTSPVSSNIIGAGVAHGMYGMAGAVMPQPLDMYGYAGENEQQGQPDEFDDAEIEVTDFRIGTGQPRTRCILEVKSEEQLYGPFVESQNEMTNPMAFGELDYNGTPTQAEGFDNLVIPNDWSGEPTQN